MFYSQRIHDKCYRRPHFDAGQFVEEFDDENAKKVEPLEHTPKKHKSPKK
jgi:Ni,Fe-hydrogenase I small subunit